jgi:hypothetical protein
MRLPTKSPLSGTILIPDSTPLAHKDALKAIVNAISNSERFSVSIETGIVQLKIR